MNVEQIYISGVVVTIIASTVMLSIRVLRNKDTPRKLHASTSLWAFAAVFVVVFTGLFWPIWLVWLCVAPFLKVRN